MKLIANMIARNEAHRYLEKVLDRLQDQVDLICFTDDNSTDLTPDIAESKGAIVQRLKSADNQPLFERSEYDLRTKSWDLVSEHASNGDWILAIDSDEMLYYPSDAYLSRLLDQDRYDVIGITFYHMWSPEFFRIDKAWRPGVSTRLFKYREGGVFKQTKLACGSEPTYVIEAVRQRKFYPRTSLAMKHLGYMNDEDKWAKYERYMKLDKGEFHNLSHIESIIDANPRLSKWTLDK